MSRPVVTGEMIEAGNNMGSLLIDATISRSLGGLGGCPTATDIPVKYKEIVDLYLRDMIDSCHAIFWAMKLEEPQ